MTSRWLKALLAPRLPVEHRFCVYMETGSLGSRTGNRRWTWRALLSGQTGRCRDHQSWQRDQGPKLRGTPLDTVPQMHGCPQTFLEDGGKAPDFGLGHSCLALAPAKAPAANKRAGPPQTTKCPSAQQGSTRGKGTWGIRDNICQPHSHEERMSKTYTELTQLNSEKQTH